MSSLGDVIFGRLIADAGTTPPAGSAVYPLQSPQAKSSIYPRIVYDCKDRDPVRTYRGLSGLVNQKATLSCKARNYRQAATIAAAVRLLFDGQRGTWGGAFVQGAFVEDENEYQETDNATAEQNLIFAVDLELSIWFEG